MGVSYQFKFITTNIVDSLKITTIFVVVIFVITVKVS